MKLVLVSNRFWPLIGGAEKTMENLAVVLAAQGHSVTVVSTAWNQKWPRECLRDGYRLVRLPRPNLRLLGTAMYLMSLYRWLARNTESYEAIICSMLKYDAVVTLKAARRNKTGAPVVLRCEGGGDTGDCSWQQSTRTRLWVRRQLRDADAIVAPSPAIAREILDAGYSSSKTCVIDNGVPISDADRDKLAARRRLASIYPILACRNTDQIVVYIGRIHEAKGLIELVDAWQQVAAGEKQRKLWIVGDGEFRAWLGAHIANQPVQDNIIMTGALEQIFQVLAASDVFVLPSHEEGMSISLLEAMSMKVPVVATDIPGNRLLIEHGVTGWLVPVGDTQAIASGLSRMLLDDCLVESIVSAARKCVEREFTVERMASRHLALFADDSAYTTN